MRIVNQHQYRLRWWMVLAATGTLALAIDSALDTRWLNAIVFSYNSYWLLTMHRFRNASRIISVEKNEFEVVVSYADGKQNSILRAEIESAHDTGPYLVVYTHHNKKRLSQQFKRSHFDRLSWKQIVGDADSWAVEDDVVKA